MSDTVSVLHLRSGEPGKTPEADVMPLGRLAINYKDVALYTKNAEGVVSQVASAEATNRALASVLSVDGRTPDTDGNIDLPVGVEYAISIPSEPEPNTTLFFQYIPHNLKFASGVIALDTPVSSLPIQILVNGVPVSTSIINGMSGPVESIADTIIARSVIRIDSPSDWQGVRMLSISLQFLVV